MTTRELVVDGEPGSHSPTGLLVAVVVVGSEWRTLNQCRWPAPRAEGAKSSHLSSNGKLKGFQCPIFDSN